MLYTKEQVISGLQEYIESEVISQLPTTGKIIAGAAIALMVKDNETLLNGIYGDYGKMLGVINTDGLIDVDKAAEALHTSMRRYGSVCIDLPVGLGKLTFTENDIDLLRRHIQ